MSTKTKLILELVAILDAKENFRNSKNVIDKADNHERLFALMASLNYEELLELVVNSSKRGVA